MLSYDESSKLYNKLNIPEHEKSGWRHWGKNHLKCLG